MLHPASSWELRHGLAPNLPTAPHLAAKNGGAGRIAALEYLSDEAKFPSGSLGYLVRRAILGVTPVVGDFASGNICNHYRSVEEFLREPATPDNISLLAERETEYWRTQETGVAWIIGGSTPAGIRKAALLCTLAKLKETGQWDEHYKPAKAEDLD